MLPRLNAIVDIDTAERAGWSPIDLAGAYLQGGAMFLQIRAKTASSGQLLDLATSIVAMARVGGAMVIVNDRADIARLAEADGVHVGQDDLAAADVRSIVGDHAIVGLSTHTTAQMESAVRQPVTYVAIGPVFGSTSKATGYEAIGLDAVRSAAARARAAGLPLVAIGGITLERAASVIEAGAASVAVISDLLATADPVSRTREYLRRIESVSPDASTS
jgi:thiamine-phosphate pyrophosphorylase